MLRALQGKAQGHWVRSSPSSGTGHGRQFEAMFLAGKLDTPGAGIMYMAKLDRVATYVPEEILQPESNS